MSCRAHAKAISSGIVLTATAFVDNSDRGTRGFGSGRRQDPTFLGRCPARRRRRRVWSESLARDQPPPWLWIHLRAASAQQVLLVRAARPDALFGETQFRVDSRPTNPWKSVVNTLVGSRVRRASGLSFCFESRGGRHVATVALRNYANHGTDHAQSRARATALTRDPHPVRRMTLPHDLRGVQS